ncbi:MAG: DEAD/DEAH box helicase [Deltaproteobacteria bacterium]|jgi:DEAD/DEAH box helicase domain-containing protein|nr:DEAD/DEAH box helicase [Deltaproteobacteria bacterium]MBW2533424.1 DEAD/DEAH box helicase [Deltaproteobacteria bacterium]
MVAPVWSQPTGVAAVVGRWLASPALVRCWTLERQLEASAGSYRDLPAELDPALRRALESRGIERLYAHQREAIDLARSGQHVVIATPTASGKSLCFHLPVLDALTRDREAKALFMYPTKALSRDQEASLHELCDAAGLGVGATVYDGDTPPDARRAARQAASIVMTNPDMLHAGILPHHASWARLLQNLRYVVLDELHTYRGVFGSHVAHVLARLRRIAEFHGASPTFVCATATIGNPTEHAARLLGVSTDEVRLVDRSTAPRGGRQLFVYNPPVVNQELGIRESYVKASVRLAADLLRARVRTIIFGRSRNTVEIMLKYLRDTFRDSPSLRDGIVAYRGGYLPETRRRIERGLRHGDVLCVVATSALELGIDVGDLDAVVCAGYPGSLAETWQRFGRAGRRGEPSIAVLVASSAPLDQYLAHHPDFLLDGAIEQARVDPENAEVVIQHLKCGAFELPFREREPYAGMPTADTEAALGFLQEHGVVHSAGGRYHWAADAFPANHVSLRRIGWDNFVIIDVDSSRAIAELDWHAAPGMLHEQAIYQHEGEQFQVEKLDYENHKAYVRKVVPDYFTTALRNRKVSVIERAAEQRPRRALLGWGEVSVVEKVVGYKKVKFHTHENAGYGDVRLPDIEMHTTSFWLTVPADLRSQFDHDGVFTEALRGLAHALELCATLALMCDPRDIGSAIEDAAPPADAAADTPTGRGLDGSFAATAYLFDNVPGGVGLAERIYQHSELLLERAVELCTACSCEHGCPCCVGANAAEAMVASSDPPADVAVLQPRKRSTLELLSQLGYSSAAR